MTGRFRFEDEVCPGFGQILLGAGDRVWRYELVLMGQVKLIQQFVIGKRSGLTAQQKYL